jgi:ribonuclease HI
MTTHLQLDSDSEEQGDAPKPSESAPSHVIIYTDGAAEPNPGPGGYGVVLIAGKHRKELSGGFQRTTNNRMELMGVIVGLESLKKPCLVTVYSDSKYVVNSVERGSVKKWSQNNWYRTPTDKAKNADLWARFLEIYARHKVRFKWVKGHAGVPENERCDELAVAAAKSYDKEPDTGYIREVSANGSVIPTAAPIQQSSDKLGSSPVASDSKTPTSNVAHKEPGEPCRKCSTPLVKKPTKKKAPKPGQTYYYEWYLSCPGCHTMYLVDEAKRGL